MIKTNSPTRLWGHKTAVFGFVLALGLVLVFIGPLSVKTDATHQGSTTLDVGSEQVLIYRDEYGVPHIFARSNRALFHAYGYVVAQDRLWQLELNRRAAHGRLAEILGPSVVPADQTARTVGYTEAELGAQFAQLDREQQEIFTAYGEGINRYVREVVVPDPANKLPFEFWALQIGVPAPWTTADSVAFAVFMARRFGEIGGRELTNQSVLNGLIAIHGAVAGFQIFNDVRWINDPDSPVTIPRGREPTDASRERSSEVLPAYLHPLTSLQLPPSFDREALKIWENLGVPTRLGSYAWVISPARSTEGSAMLYGGPQMGF
ncbi:MAG: penicillin acylase family protein, partial [Acidimicrobiia bacterium]